MDSRSIMTLKSSVVIFRALETSAASLTLAASATSLALEITGLNSLYSPISSKLPDPDGLIICPFLWNGSSKIKNFIHIPYWNFFSNCRSNVENEAGMGAAAAKGRVTRAARTAMTDIGNKANLLQNAKNLNNKGM